MHTIFIFRHSFIQFNAQHCMKFGIYFRYTLIGVLTGKPCDQNYPPLYSNLYFDSALTWIHFIVSRNQKNQRVCEDLAFIQPAPPSTPAPEPLEVLSFCLRSRPIYILILFRSYVSQSATFSLTAC